MLRRVSAAVRRPGTGTKSRNSILMVRTSCAMSPVVPSTDAAASATLCKIAHISEYMR
jgi:hypothetical protein